MATIKEDCFSCGWYNPRHTGSDMPKCDKLGKLTNPYNPICNHDNNQIIHRLRTIQEVS